jgi:peptidoglycan/xylan/chitin deacetylase (PgdA/CDA1 family)
MDLIADLEERYGFRSSWNLPLDQYSIDWKQIDRLRERGFEFGAHGLRHDGKLFRSEPDFKVLSPKVHCLADEHGLRGFRAPSTLRRAEWIASMTFDYDSSFSDTDPWEPQPGGTCSVFPFFLGERMIELPYTLPQDHTLIHILRRDPLPVWILKANWLAALGGMILTLTHPDYITYCLGKYEELLKHLTDIDNAWRALPSEVAAWWRRRATLDLHEEGSSLRIDGEPSEAVVRALGDEALADYGRSLDGGEALEDILTARVLGGLDRIGQ